MKRLTLLATILIVLSILLSACAQPTPEVVEKVVTSIVVETVKETVIVEGEAQVVEKEVTKVVEKVVTEIVEKEVVVTATAEPEAEVEDIFRMARLDIISSVQPYHAYDDGRWAESKIGQERARYTYAFNSLHQAGSVLALGSDWTVAPLDPIMGIYAAVTRHTMDGGNPDGWFPEEKIPLNEAIKGYTINAAFAEFEEDSKGSIENGKLADFVVLDQNLFDIPPEKIKDTQVLFTVFNGRIVYRRR